ncbi:MAG TPA: hypothetical protein DCL21_01620 [Alphaproteobacteria bacterium]|nr:hypothetical protein [Alphaproteobacteria bacterium]
MTQYLNFDINSHFDEEITPKIAREIFSKSMTVMRNEAITQANNFSDTGEITSKIQLKVLSVDSINLISGANHSAPMEYGTQPHWAPIDPLKKWASRKLGDEKIGYAVQKKIAKEGTQAKPYMRSALDITTQTHLPIIIQEVKSKFN